MYKSELARWSFDNSPLVRSMGIAVLDGLSSVVLPSIFFLLLSPPPLALLCCFGARNTMSSIPSENLLGLALFFGSLNSNMYVRVSSASLKRGSKSGLKRLESTSDLLPIIYWKFDSFSASSCFFFLFTCSSIISYYFYFSRSCSCIRFGTQRAHNVYHRHPLTEAKMAEKVFFQNLLPLRRSLKTSWSLNPG